MPIVELFQINLALTHLLLQTDYCYVIKLTLMSFAGFRMAVIDVNLHYRLMEENSEQLKQAQLQVLCLGAGQDVGRSCVCVTLKDKTIMFDVGIHMLYSDHRRYPEFGQLYTPPATINQAVHLVLLTHFHLDHCGALPYLTEHHGYSGPILASTPTKALLPLMLEDYRKVISEQKKEEQFYVFTAGQVRNSADRVKSIGLFETVEVNGIKVTSYYAGHVLGACMFHVEYAGLSVVYTGDYNSYADRHLGAASAPRLSPNLLITETTYATTIRDTKRDRERTMLQLITETVEKGGKVLIPVFALGRAQELSVLLQSYWKRTDSSVPIYFSAGLIERANLFYRLFVDWQNEKIQQEFAAGDNMFEFKKVKPFDKSLLKADMPYVLFATPGMLHGGSSMQVFKEWCADERNTLIIPGYCVEGTLGNKLLRGAKEVMLDKKLYEVKMKVVNVSFSAHADAKGIINLLRNIDPENIMLVHGDRTKMEAFSPLLQQQLSKPVFMPANHQRITIDCIPHTELQLTSLPTASKGFLFSHAGEYCLAQQKNFMKEVNRILAMTQDNPKIAVSDPIQCQFTFYDQDVSPSLIKKHGNSLKFTSCCDSKSQMKEQQSFVKREAQLGDEMKVQGKLQSVAAFLKDLKALKRGEKQ